MRKVQNLEKALHPFFSKMIITIIGIIVMSLNSNNTTFGIVLCMLFFFPLHFLSISFLQIYWSAMEQKFKKPKTDHSAES